MFFFFFIFEFSIGIRQTKILTAIQHDHCLRFFLFFFWLFCLIRTRCDCKVHCDDCVCVRFNVYFRVCSFLIGSLIITSSKHWRTHTSLPTSRQRSFHRHRHRSCRSHSLCSTHSHLNHLSHSLVQSISSVVCARIAINVCFIFKKKIANYFLHSELLLLSRFNDLVFCSETFLL